MNFRERRTLLRLQSIPGSLGFRQRSTGALQVIWCRSSPQMDGRLFKEMVSPLVMDQLCPVAHLHRLSRALEGEALVRAGAECAAGQQGFDE